MALGTVSLAQAAPSATNGNSSQKAARILVGIKVDATQVRSAAARLDDLTKSANAQWLDYDRQWNELQPSVERMQIKLERLEAMQNSLSPSESNELGQYKVLIQEIQGRARELRALLDKPGVQMNDVKFKTYARGLLSETGKLEKLPAER